MPVQEFQIVDLDKQGAATRQQVAELIYETFKDVDAWPTLESANEEVEESLGAERISRVAIDNEGNVLGWIGGIGDAYDGHAWELHPLAVHADFRGQGIGRALVADLEEQVRARGGTTVFLGTDDEKNQTSLGGVDLYPDVLGKARHIQNLGMHPYTFYKKLGYVIVGLIPDANGFGKPDILMAKRIAG